MTSDDPPINRCRELTTKQKFAVVVSFCLVFVGVVVLFVWNVNYYQAKTDKSSQNDTGTYLDGAFQSDLDLLTAFNAILQRNAYNGYKKPMWEELNETVTTHRKRQIELIGNEDPDHQFQLALSRYNSAKRNSSANLEIEKERVQEALILSRNSWRISLWSTSRGQGRITLQDWRLFLHRSTKPQMSRLGGFLKRTSGRTTLQASPPLASFLIPIQQNSWKCTTGRFRLLSRGTHAQTERQNMAFYS
ncbi:hypothetical protein L596_009247 [Steinernema carpocapsae]|uniref:Uncharacterized protein n=1 Tax=Steinernema carpocapsae TaxID=34508 RepID=A0A4U5PG03_STECR|nr:hypothetical protein L596_009247 [Steinernema carpocapsae]